MPEADKHRSNRRNVTHFLPPNPIFFLFFSGSYCFPFKPLLPVVPTARTHIPGRSRLPPPPPPPLCTAHLFPQMPQRVLFFFPPIAFFLAAFCRVFVFLSCFLILIMLLIEETSSSTFSHFFNAHDFPLLFYIINLCLKDPFNCACNLFMFFSFKCLTLLSFSSYVYIYTWVLLCSSFWEENWFLNEIQEEKTMLSILFFPP